MSGTTSVGDLNIRLRARYAFMLALLVLGVGGSPLVMAVILPDEIATEIRVWHLLGMLAMPLGLVMLIFAIADRFRVARARLIRPDNKRVKEAWRVARINLVLAALVPLAVVICLVLKQLPAETRDQLMDILDRAIPGIGPGDASDLDPDNSGAADNAPAPDDPAVSDNTD